MPFRLSGLTAAAFTPLDENGALLLDRIPAIVDHLEQDGVSGLYLLGSTGEGLSLSSEERRDVAEAYIDAARGRLNTVVQVGHNSLKEARRLAGHARDAGADAISMMPPFYDKPESVGLLIDCLAEVAASAPDLPLYYYHIPMKTGVEVDVRELLERGKNRVPSLHGVKYSDFRLHAFHQCTGLDQEFDFLIGADEILLSALAAGIRGAVGSTYNFAAPLYLKIIRAFERGNMKEAQHSQELAVRMINRMFDTCGSASLKTMMQIIGQDCGPCRLPRRTAEPEEVAQLKRELEAMGYFEWGRTRSDGLSSDGVSANLETRQIHE